MWTKPFWICMAKIETETAAMAKQIQMPEVTPTLEKKRREDRTREGKSWNGKKRTSISLLS